MWYLNKLLYSNHESEFNLVQTSVGDAYVRYNLQIEYYIIDMNPDLGLHRLALAMLLLILIFK